MAKRPPAVKKPEGNGSGVDRQILATLEEILSTLKQIESVLPSGDADALTLEQRLEQRLEDILRELRTHRPARTN
jgi:hypothetical protein